MWNFLSGVATGIVSTVIMLIAGMAVDWIIWRIGPEDSVLLNEPQEAKAFFELTLYSIADGACNPAAKDETGRSCSVLLEFQPDDLRYFVTERVPFYRSGTHREMLEGFLDQNVGCLKWSHRWTMNGDLYTISEGPELRRDNDGDPVCPRQIGQNTN